jgi:hypothetical protein
MAPNEQREPLRGMLYLGVWNELVPKAPIRLNIDRCVGKINNGVACSVPLPLCPVNRQNILLAQAAD